MGIASAGDDIVQPTAGRSKAGERIHLSFTLSADRLWKSLPRIAPINRILAYSAAKHGAVLKSATLTLYVGNTKLADSQRLGEGFRALEMKD